MDAGSGDGSNTVGFAAVACGREAKGANFPGGKVRAKDPTAKSRSSRRAMFAADNEDAEPDGPGRDAQDGLYVVQGRLTWNG